jgi:tetratricopeptide (TPR) repeat protein
MKYLAGTLLYLVLSVSVYAQQAVLEHTYSEPFIADPGQAQVFDELSQLFTTDLEQASKLAHEQANKLLASEKHAENPALAGQMLSNAAIADAALGHYQQAAHTFEQALKLIEAEYKVFSPNLLNALLASGITSIQLEKMQDAENKFRWAQHIQHRQDGVFSLGQTEVIDWLTRLHLLQNRLAAADLVQMFGLRVAESNFASGSDSLSDARLKAASYFSERGSKLPFGVGENYLLSRDNIFRQSVGLYKSAIVSIESAYGHNDPRLIEPLRSFAKTRIRQRTSVRAATPLLERVLGIIAKQSEVDPLDHIRAWLELGDIHIITGGKQARTAYAAAWVLLENLPGETEARNSLFTEPKLLYPNRLAPLFLERRPGAASPDEDEFYADISYVVSEAGKVEKIDIHDRNVPNSQIKILKSLLMGSRFRPRLVAGEPEEFARSQRQPFLLLPQSQEPSPADDTPQEAESTVPTETASPDDIETQKKE